MPVRAVPRPPVPFGKPSHTPTLDLPGAVGARLAQRGPLALLGSVETLAPTLDQILPARTRLPRFARPTCVRTPGDPPSEPRSDPAAPLYKGKANYIRHHLPQEAVHESGASPVPPCLRLVPASDALTPTRPCDPAGWAANVPSHCLLPLGAALPYIKKHDIITFHKRAPELAGDFRWVDERRQTVAVAPISRFPGRKGTAWAMTFIANAVLHGAPFTPDEDYGWLRLSFAELKMWCYQHWLRVGGNPAALRKTDGFPASVHTDNISFRWAGVPALLCMTSAWQTPDDRYILSSGAPRWIKDALASAM